jgi:hypothetical protein
MTLYKIPISGAADGPFYFTVDLGGTNYQLKFQFNERDSAWYMDILDTAGNPMRSGIKVVVNFPLLTRWRDDLRPPGELAGIDLTADPIDPTMERLGEDCVLYYNE